MEFTRYIWELYVNTDQGREALSKEPYAISDVAATITVAVLEENEQGECVEQAQEDVETIEIDLA